MGFAQRRWTREGNAPEDLYGRVWTDPSDLSAWVVLLDRPRSPSGRASREPRLIFRRGAEEWSSPVAADVRLTHLEDERLCRYLRRARVG